MIAENKHVNYKKMEIMVVKAFTCLNDDMTHLSLEYLSWFFSCLALNALYFLIMFVGEGVGVGDTVLQ